MPVFPLLQDSFFALLPSGKINTYMMVGKGPAFLVRASSPVELIDGMLRGLVDYRTDEESQSTLKSFFEGLTKIDLSVSGDKLDDMRMTLIKLLEKLPADKQREKIRECLLNYTLFVGKANPDEDKAEIVVTLPLPVQLCDATYPLWLFFADREMNVVLTRAEREDIKTSKKEEKKSKSLASESTEEDPVPKQPTKKVSETREKKSEKASKSKKSSSSEESSEVKSKKSTKKSSKKPKKSKKAKSTSESSSESTPQSESSSEPVKKRKSKSSKKSKASSSSEEKSKSKEGKKGKKLTLKKGKSKASSSEEW
jgi:hypothetical protein